jgi:aryl-alcohol dehydrogenase-like predicted oxidoreductase
MSAVALAWLCADETIAAPVASARTPAQLAELLPPVDRPDVRRARAADSRRKDGGYLTGVVASFPFSIT